MSAATANQSVNKEAVRMLVATLGYQDTAKQTGISANTLYQWARRYHWKTPIPHSQDTVRTVRNPSDVLQDELERNGRATKLSLSRYTARAAKDAERATLRDSGHVLNVAKTHQVLFPPEQNKSNILNLAILTGREIPEKHVEGEVIENE